ncbi:MAG: endonuclease/exonuclease/phosphatase family protein [Clostridia bacterium]|nr:endonuclease/exonuclease/phosphatase family protein [Clostridia bacterium]
MKKTISLILSLLILSSVFAAAAYAAPLPGDTNGDGKLNNKDVYLLFRYVSGNSGGVTEENCDFNGDSRINNKDVTLLFRHVSSLPVQQTTVIDFDSALKNDVLSYFTKPSYCAVSSVKDETEGDVIKISTSVNVPSGRKPAVYFLYGDYSESIYETPADFTKRPFVFLKVKTVNAHDRLFDLTGSASDKNASAANQVSARIPGGDGWHYICFDFTGASDLGKFRAFRINFEQLTGDEGEAVLISEMRVCTAEEAKAYEEKDVFVVQEQTMQDYKIKVMQFNIQTENGNGAPFISRSEMYRKLVEELQPDVVGMQEVTVNWRKWLDSYVFNDSYDSVGVARSAKAEEGLEANPIYYRKDKFDLIDSGTFWLSSTPDVAGSKIEDLEVEVEGETVKYSANYPRICTWVQLKDKVTGAEFVHLNTHLDHNGNNKSTGGNAIRKKEMGVIIKFAQRFNDLPMFLTGDLNNMRTTSKGETYALIKMIEGKSKFTDTDGTKYTIKLADTRLNAPVTVDSDHTATMTKYYNESYEPTREPIDYVFYDPETTEPLTYQTYLISEDDVWISDHLPLFTTFRIK